LELHKQPQPLKHQKKKLTVANCINVSTPKSNTFAQTFGNQNDFRSDSNALKAIFSFDTLNQTPTRRHTHINGQTPTHKITGESDIDADEIARRRSSIYNGPLRVRKNGAPTSPKATPTRPNYTETVKRLASDLANVINSEANLSTPTFNSKITPSLVRRYPLQRTLENSPTKSSRTTPIKQILQSTFVSSTEEDKENEYYAFDMEYPV